jgi:hypothetical protein
MAAVAMPEAAVREEHGPMLRKNEVRLAGQAGYVEAKSET